METRVYSILKRKGDGVVTAIPDQNIASFAALLYAHRIGATPVVDAENHVVGMISERDVIRGIIEHGALVLTLPVSALMTKLVSTCTPDEQIGSGKKIPRQCGQALVAAADGCRSAGTMGARADG